LGRADKAVGDRHRSCIPVPTTMPKPEREFFVADSEDAAHTGEKEWER
jgi:hypothetical protein